MMPSRSDIAVSAHLAPDDLLNELLATRRPTQADLDALRSRGIPAMALIRPLPIGVDIVAFSRLSFEFVRYRQADVALRSYILPALDELGELQDLVAWHPKSGSLGSWLGRSALLGAEHIFGPRLDEVLPVYETPLDWLRAERWGCVPIDMKRAATVLRDGAPLGAADLDYQRRLTEALTVRPPLVLVAVPETERTAA